MKAQLIVPWIDGHGVRHEKGSEIDVPTKTYAERVAFERACRTGLLAQMDGTVYDSDVSEYTPPPEGAEVVYTPPPDSSTTPTRPVESGGVTPPEAAEAEPEAQPAPTPTQKGRSQG